MPKLLFGMIGLVLGWLAAAQFPLWPTPSGGLFQSWSGAWNTHADGNLYRDTARLICPHTIKAFVLETASYVGSEGTECSYRHPDELFDLSVHLEPPTFKQDEGKAATVTLVRGDVRGRRVTDLEEGYSDLLKQDILIVEGTEAEVFVRCYSSTPLDVPTCHRAQADFFSDVDPLSLGPEPPN